MRFNLHSILNAVQAILPTLRQQGWERIVNISSLATLGLVNPTAIAASKAALGNFTHTWTLEVAEAGITVNSVAPWALMILGEIDLNLLVAFRRSPSSPDPSLTEPRGIRRYQAGSTAFFNTISGKRP